MSSLVSWGPPRDLLTNQTRSAGFIDLRRNPGAARAFAEQGIADWLHAGHFACSDHCEYSSIQHEKRLYTKEDVGLF